MSNVNKVTPEVELKLAGKTLTLVFDLWALASVERESGKNVPELLMSGSMSGVLQLLKAATLKHHEELTEEEIGHMIDLTNLNEIMITLTKAFESASPKQEPEAGTDEKKVKSQPSGTG